MSRYVLRPNTQYLVKGINSITRQPIEFYGEWHNKEWCYYGTRKRVENLILTKTKNTEE